jgi:hypothetical protein
MILMTKNDKETKRMRNVQEGGGKIAAVGDVDVCGP